MRNKRGDAAIVFLVFMVLVLFIFALFKFASAQTISLEGFDLSKIEKVSSTKLAFEQSLNFAAQKAAVKTFDEFSKGDNYDYIYARKSTGEFFKLHEKLKENFANRFKENFLEIFSSQTSSDKSIANEYEMIKKQKGNLDVSFDNDNISIKFNYVYAPDTVESINVQDSARIELKIPLNKIGLNGFDEIYLTKEKCKSLGDVTQIRDCFEKYLINFDAEVLPAKENAGKFGFTPIDSSTLNIVKLTSKSDFSFIDGDKNIELDFIPR